MILVVCIYYMMSDVMNYVVCRYNMLNGVIDSKEVRMVKAVDHHRDQGLPVITDQGMVLSRMLGCKK
jgi:hypothetical protein